MEKAADRVHGSTLRRGVVVIFVGSHVEAWTIALVAVRRLSY